MILYSKELKSIGNTYFIYFSQNSSYWYFFQAWQPKGSRFVRWYNSLGKRSKAKDSASKGEGLDNA